MKNSIFLPLLLFITLLNPLFAEDLEILFEERSPYVEIEDNSIKGLVASKLTASLEKNRIKYLLIEKPSKRHLYEIKANNKKVCAVGWFKNKKREEFAKFSKALYEDKPMGIVVKRDNTKIKEFKDIDMLLQEKSFKLLMKNSYSYGNIIDKKIIDYKTNFRRVSSDNKTMLKLINKKRADYMFISYEEAMSLFKEYKASETLEFISLLGVPKGNKRYLICSKKVDDELLNSINRYLD